MNQLFHLAYAAILLAVRLPSFMTRLGMSKSDKIWFVIIIFSLLGFMWFMLKGIGMLSGFLTFLSYGGLLKS